MLRAVVISQPASRPVSQQGRQLNAPFGTDGQAPAGYSPKRPVSNYHTQGNEMKEILGLSQPFSPQKNGFGKKPAAQNVSGGEEAYRPPREDAPSPLGSPQPGRFAEDDRQEQDHIRDDVSVAASQRSSNSRRHEVRIGADKTHSFESAKERVLQQ